MESTDSSIGSPPPPQPHLPPGFRFHPTDEELVVHYLKKKATSAPLPVAIIADIDLYKFDPWELPAKAMFGEQEWYFFSPRDRKYPNGTRPNRAATSGYWKATGTDKPVLTSGGAHKVGVKKALVFYGGKPPKGIKTSWIMHEYRLTDNNKPNNKPPAGCDAAGNMKNSLRLDDWVLCRIYHKNNAQRIMDHDRDDHVIGSAVQQQNHVTKFHCPNNKPAYYGALLENEKHMLGSILGSEVTAAMVQQPSASRLPLKRTLPSLWWSDADPSAAAGRTAAGEGNSSAIGTLLEHLPHTPPQLLQQSLFGVLGHDGVFQQQFQLSDMNWYN